MNGRSNGVVWWGLASAVGMLLGAFTPWVTALGISFNGTDFPHSDGWLLVALAVLGGLCVLGARDRPGLATVTLLTGLAGAGITLYDREHLAAAINNAGDLGKALVHVGWGLNLAVLASVSLLAQGLVALFRIDSATPEPAGRETWTAPARPPLSFSTAAPAPAVSPSEVWTAQTQPVPPPQAAAPAMQPPADPQAGADAIVIQLWQLLVAVAVACVALGGGGVYLLTRDHSAAPPVPAQSAIAQSARTAYRQFAQAELDATAKADVRSAIPAAEAYYQANTLRSDSYAGLDQAELAAQAPGVSPNVRVVVLNRGQGYCLDEQQPGGHRFYYVGGTPAQVGGRAVGVISSGSCPR